MKKIIFTLLLLVSSISFADTSVPIHNCGSTKEIINYQDLRSTASYNQKVTAYRVCVQDFITKQKEAVLVHEMAIKLMFDEWNVVKDYVNSVN